MLKKIICMLLTILCIFTFCACNSDDDDDDDNNNNNRSVTIRTNELSIVNDDGSVNTYTYEQGKTSLTDILPDGSTKDCFCQRLAFRSAQALMANESFSKHYPEGIPKHDLRIVTKWNTDGAEELFVESLDWADDDIRIKLNATDHNDLSLEDAVFYFVPRTMETAWKVSAQAKLFPTDFFTLRKAAKTGGSEEKSAFKPAKEDAMENYLKPIPLEDAFTVEEITPSSENLEASLSVFAGWEGKWVSSYSYLDDPAMESAYEAVVNIAPGYTRDEIKDFMGSMYRSDFASAEAAGETIIWHATDTVSGATVSDSRCEYKPAGKESVPWGEYEVVWHKFESLSQECYGYNYLLFTEVHSHEDGLTHWHMRYGDTSFSDLINYSDPIWWPTLFKDGTPAEKVAEDMSAEADEFVTMLPSKGEKIGVMVIAHGSDETEWNNAVQDIVNEVNLPYPTALGFLEFHDQNIEAAADSLEKLNVNKIVAVPVFICSYSNHIEEIRYVLGLRDTLPEEEEVPGHGNEGGEEEELIPIETDVEIILTPALDDAPEVADILSEHLETISTQPDQEIAVLVGHGGDSTECLEKWNQNFSSLASQIKTRLGLKDARYGYVAMGEPSIAEVVSQAQEEGDVLVVPVMLSRGYFIQVKIPQALEGLNYRYADKALLPSAGIATLIQTRVNEVLGDE